MRLLVRDGLSAGCLPGLPRGGLGKCGRIEPVTLRSAARGCSVRILAWDVVRAQRYLIPEDRSVRSRCDGQAPAGGVARHAGDLPAAKETAYQSFPGSEEWQPVDVVHRQNMLAIEVLITVLGPWIARVLRKAGGGGGVLTVRISTGARKGVGDAEREIVRRPATDRHLQRVVVGSRRRLIADDPSVPEIRPIRVQRRRGEPGRRTGRHEVQFPNAEQMTRLVPHVAHIGADTPWQLALNAEAVGGDLRHLEIGSHSLEASRRCGAGNTSTGVVDRPSANLHRSDKRW